MQPAPTVSVLLHISGCGHVEPQFNQRVGRLTSAGTSHEYRGWSRPDGAAHSLGVNLSRPFHADGHCDCYAVPDERAAMDAEIGRLQAENEKLKAQLASREPTVTGKVDEALPKSDPLKKAEPKAVDGERKIEIPLPSDQDMDRVMSFLERAWRRLMEMANRMQKDVSGKI